ncbi:MFS transporter [Paracoccus aurantiacus]|uniref:MFS transporter n=1 Tax=Paracoccus aurantiacus TaxID=2599412 RepID=A0A5C6RZC6_9RHOB|nr:MFS transporter [Paracoccus aurantiacus]TXB67427.1 MFS transporter [Paracoccus aurantiacus]
MTKLNARSAGFALIAGHVAGMIDLAALPIWVDTLIGGYGYRPAMGGALPTGFLLGAVIASLFLSRRFDKVQPRMLAPAGYWIAGACFLAMTFMNGFAIHLLLHLIGGMAAGTALSVVHGTMGRAENPHRMFAYAGIGFGLFSLLFLGGVPQLIGVLGPQAFFYAAGGTMLAAAIITTLWMPEGSVPETVDLSTRFPRPVRFAIEGIMGMALIQGLVFSYLIQVGNARGFGEGNVEIVLILLGIVNLFPPALAALLENCLPAIGVSRVGPIVQGVFALLIMLSGSFMGYAVPAIFFAAVMIFTHTFVFGFIARHDPTGSAVSATPAMLMTGSAVAPFLGGALVEIFGFGAIGSFAAIVAIACSWLFARAGQAAGETGGTAPATN